MKKTNFNDCELQEVDFTETDLSLVNLSQCNLMNATFDRSNLERADFSSAINYTIDPEINFLKKAKFSTNGLVGLLSKYGIDII